MYRYFIVFLVNRCFRYHTLRGTYGVADLRTLASYMLPTSLQGNFLRLAKKDGVRAHRNLFVSWARVTYIHTVLLNFRVMETSKHEQK